MKNDKSRLFILFSTFLIFFIIFNSFPGNSPSDSDISFSLDYETEGVIDDLEHKNIYHPENSQNHDYESFLDFLEIALSVISEGFRCCPCSCSSILGFLAVGVFLLLSISGLVN